MNFFNKSNRNVFTVYIQPHIYNLNFNLKHMSNRKMALPWRQILILIFVFFHLSNSQKYLLVELEEDGETPKHPSAEWKSDSGISK